MKEEEYNETKVLMLGNYRITHEVENGKETLKVICLNGALSVHPKTTNSIIIDHRYK